MNSRQRKTLLLILCVSTVVTACGFQLRGSGRQSGSVIVGQVYIEDSGGVSVVQQLRNALTAQQVQFAAFRKDALKGWRQSR